MLFCQHNKKFTSVLIPAFMNCETRNQFTGFYWVTRTSLQVHLQFYSLSLTLCLSTQCVQDWIFELLITLSSDLVWQSKTGSPLEKRGVWRWQLGFGSMAISWWRVSVLKCEWECGSLLASSVRDLHSCTSVIQVGLRKKKSYKVVMHWNRPGKW